MKNLLSLFFIIGFIKETQAMVNHDFEKEKVHADSHNPFSFLKVSFGGNIKNPLKSHYFRHKVEKNISECEKDPAFLTTKKIEKLAILREKIEKLNNKPLSDKEQIKNKDLLIKIDSLTNNKKSSLPEEKINSSLISEEISTETNPSLPIVTQKSSPSSSSSTSTIVPLRRLLPSEPSFNSLLVLPSSVNPESSFSPVVIPVVTITEEAKFFPIIGSPSLKAIEGSPSPTSTSPLSKALVPYKKTSFSLAAPSVENKQSFFASQIKHRLIRVGILTTLFYMKSLYSCYKMNPKNSKITLLKQSFQTLKKDKFFYGGLLTALIVPKIYGI